ncbi:MAG: TMEM165/GDT1 family protein [Methanobacteriota archaeon]
MEGVAAFGTALGLVLLLELGDKTQLATISLASRHPWTPVLAGAVAGLLLVTAIGAAIGGILAVVLAAWLNAIQVGGGVLFVAFGVWTYLHVEGETEPRPGRSAFVTAFALNLVAELGDKTQLATIVLAATTAAPVSVFAGAGLALTVVAVSSVAIGTALAKVLAARWIRLASTALFIAAGAILIVEAVLGA